MPSDRPDRRRARRWQTDSDGTVAHVRLRGGRHLDVVDISSLGVLVSGSAPLRPGTHLDVHVTTAAGRMLVRATVVRCSVWSLSSTEVVYRGALAFQTAVQTRADDPWESASHAR